ncbi:sister chromatid cohesion protein PDS5 homolog A-like isoform X2 [Aristolochia californica]|uniref:sister chromatid cohesion protein PDS5 homolog A-like isoform X2 n=1 Tax=Aristolochia californica TaxID=171875 RepID=UPI0035DC0C59
MAQKLQQQLREVGSKLENPPASKDALIKLLKQAATCLSELDQSPPPGIVDSMQPCLNAIAKAELLKHQDRDVKVLVATCICEITRITAPEAPYSDDILRDIFHLIVGIFKGLGDVHAPSFGRRVVILETLARYRSCVVMLDLECDDLVNALFSTFFAVASDDHPENVLTSMQTIMVLLLDESEDVPDKLLLNILSVLGQQKSDVSMAARRLAMNVIQHCAGKLEPCIKQFLLSSISGDTIVQNGQLDYHDVIYDLYECAPHILSGIIPYLTGELLTDELNVRLKAVKLLGELFSLPGHAISETFQPLFIEFLKRLTDRVVEVRISVIEHVKDCILSNPSRAEAPNIIAALSDRLLDYDENVRKQVVAAIYDLACLKLKSVPAETSRLVAERLRDKSLLVKRYTMERLAELYSLYCLKYSDGSVSSDDFDWMPGKILRCLYDKDFRSETIEAALCGSLTPTGISVKDKVKQWVTVFSVLEKVDIKALEKLLVQKQRLQQEMQKYLSLRQMYQDGDGLELKKRISGCFRTMSRWFSDPSKAEESFETLNQLKDTNIWRILTFLLDPNTTLQQALTYRDDLLKILGDKHPLYNFLNTLSIKCSYLLFNKEYVKEILAEAAAQKSAGNFKVVKSCMNLLVILASYLSLFLMGAEEELVQLLKEENDIIKEGILHVLAKAGGTIREQLSTTSSSVDLLLERLCLEGSRKQAKYSVQALAAITRDDGLKSLSILYKRLVDMLEKQSHLPAILQSLGCIAQTAMPVFETREDEIVHFITTKILECSNAEDVSRTSWDEPSELCLLKTYGIKALVKSFLPVKDAPLRQGIEKLLEILSNILSFGEISEEIKSSNADKAHLRLCSAKAILRLSKYWDQKIPVDVFHLTLRTSQDSYPQVRKLFLNKVHQYIKERLLDAKYACAFLFNIIEAQPPEFKEDKHNLIEIIQMCQQLKARQVPANCDGISTLVYPESILSYLVHALAHHPSCPNIDECKEVRAFEPIYRQLHLFLTAMLHGYEEGKSGFSPNRETLHAVISIFHSIKSSEDYADGKSTKMLHAICDLGLSITKHRICKKGDFTDYTTTFPLPSALYNPLEKKEGDNTEGVSIQSWLADDSVMTHFESLKLEDKAGAGVVKDEKDLEDGDGDGPEMPIGRLMESLKSPGRKKRGKRRKSSVEGSAPENDYGILGLVREINLDSLDKDEFVNDHEHTLGKKAADKDTNPLSLKSKKRKTIKEMSASASKRKRSSIEEVAPNSSISMNSSKGKQKTSASADGGKRPSKSMTADPGPAESDLVLSCLPPIKTFSSRGKGKDKLWSANNPGHVDSEPANHDDVGPLLSEDDDKKSKSSSKSIKKRKRKTIAGLVKCSLEKDQKQDAELVGCRVKVWWPIDKQFYEGMVQSYEPGKKKHVIQYDDGDVEVLQLEKERWEVVSNGLRSKKKLKSSNALLPKELSSGQKKTQRDGVSRSKSGSKFRRKAIPRESMDDDEGTSGSNSGADNSAGGSRDTSEISNSHLPADSEVDESGHSGEEESREETGEELTGSKESESPEKSDSSSDGGDSKDSDDEPLSVWKRRAAKVA